MNTNTAAQLEFYVRCPFGLEKTTAKELAVMKIRGTRPLKGGVAFFGTLEQAYRACLWLRSASRVLLVLQRFSAKDADALYAGARAIDWSLHLLPTTTFAIHARGVNDNLKNTQFTALKVKDALCDSLTEKFGKRPNVQQKRPDVQLEVALRQDKATLYLDLSGEPLHRRGYRAEGQQSEAPLKENLAAGILLQSGWSAAAAPQDFLLDPLCGSGTLVIEGAMIAADMAPGILRDYWGFSGWVGHREDVWNNLLDEAEVRLEKGRSHMPYLVGSDNDARVIELALQNARRAGLSSCVYFACSDAAEVRAVVASALIELAKSQGQSEEARHEPTIQDEDARGIGALCKGLVVTNPPYAERMMTKEELPQLYAHIKQGLSSLPAHWNASIITSDPSIDLHVGMTPFASETLYNGRIETTLRQYHLEEANARSVEVNRAEDGALVTIQALDKGSGQFAARLKKVVKERRKWAKREGVTCYRVYDADLPDYAVAIDRYEGVRGSTQEVYACVAEYRAPKEIDPQKAQRRLHDALAIIPDVMGIEKDKVIAKVRQHAKGGGQYHETGEVASTRMIVKEAGLSFEVDLSGYLDTGLFLDHRITRSLIKDRAQGKDFLNLFAYTGTATVYAAAGGARSTTTVDLSNTYLSWAERNMKLNGFCGNEHKRIRADVLDWLKQERAHNNLYDFIFVDPPTFSNSKKMDEASWSVQRDHVELLKAVSAVLRQGGEAIFSCNLRSFKPNTESLASAGIKLEDLSERSIPEDFVRNKKIHTCYVVTSS